MNSIKWRKDAQIFISWSSNDLSACIKNEDLLSISHGMDSAQHDCSSKSSSHGEYIISTISKHLCFLDISFKVIILQGEADRLITLERSIDVGKSVHDAAERDLQKFHAAFHSAYEQFTNLFDALICSAPDRLKEIYDEMEKLIKKVCFLLP